MDLLSLNQTPPLLFSTNMHGIIRLICCIFNHLEELVLVMVKDKAMMMKLQQKITFVLFWLSSKNSQT